MDKQTLSHYGWIVVLILILSVMIAFATPFGNFIANAVRTTANGLFDVNENALNAAGMSMGEVINYNFMDIIERGQYRYMYMGGNPTYDEYITFRAKNQAYASTGRWVDTKEEALDILAGFFGLSSFQQAVSLGYGDLIMMFVGNEYSYNQQLANGDFVDAWRVMVVDKSLTQYDAIPSKVDGHPVMFLNNTFSGCANLNIAPVIPNTVIDISCMFLDCTSLINPPVIPSSIKRWERAFGGCTSLEVAPLIPQNVEDVYGVFSGCTSLKTYVGSQDADGDFSNYKIPNGVDLLHSTFQDCTKLVKPPVIPNSVTCINYMFDGCTALTTAPVIPSNVTDAISAFEGCVSLTGDVEINSSPSHNQMFKDTVLPIRLTGTATNKASIMITGNNDNVTYDDYDPNAPSYKEFCDTIYWNGNTSGLESITLNVMIGKTDSQTTIVEESPRALTYYKVYDEYIDFDVNQVGNQVMNWWDGAPSSFGYILDPSNPDKSSFVQGANPGHGWASTCQTSSDYTLLVSDGSLVVNTNSGQETIPEGIWFVKCDEADFYLYNKTLTMPDHIMFEHHYDVCGHQQFN